MAGGKAVDAIKGGGAAFKDGAQRLVRPALPLQAQPAVAVIAPAVDILAVVGQLHLAAQVEAAGIEGLRLFTAHAPEGKEDVQGFLEALLPPAQQIGFPPGTQLITDALRVFPLHIPQERLRLVLRLRRGGGHRLRRGR